MRLPDARLVPWPRAGAGYLARWERVVCLAGPDGGGAGADPVAVQGLFELCRAADARGGVDAVALLDTITVAIDRRGGLPPAFAVLVDDGDVVWAGRHGAVVTVGRSEPSPTAGESTSNRSEQAQRDDGPDDEPCDAGDPAGADRDGPSILRLGPSTARIAVRLPAVPDPPPSADLLADLRQGIVAADGFVLLAGRPATVRLRFDDGTVRITGEVVVGRDPSRHPDVIAGRAVGLVPAGNAIGLSRVHARLRVDTTVVWLTDDGSTNGTFVWDEPQRRWRRLVPHHPHPLRAGDQLSFGELTAALEGSSPA
jgi:hypothetical protein